MKLVFDDFNFIKKLADTIGIDRTINLIFQNMKKTNGRLSSRDVLNIYDSEYTAMIAAYPAVKMVNGHPLHYYAQFIFDSLTMPSCRPGSTVLDVGCGDGDLSMALASVGYHVFGFDYSPTAIASAIRKGSSATFASGSIRFAAMDVDDIEGRYDYIVYSDVVEHLSTDELRAALKKSHSLLQESGQLMIHTPNGNLDVSQSRGLYRIFTVTYRILEKILQRLARRPLTEAQLRHAYYQQVHIGVMTPEKLKGLLIECGFGDITFSFRQDRNMPFGKLLASLGISTDMGVVAAKRAYK